MPRNLVIWGMADLQYLIEREREEDLRVSSRYLSFPDGDRKRIGAYRLVWRWYDRLLDCPYTFDEDEIIAMIPRCAEHEGVELDEALTRVVAVLVGRLDREGIDVTDDGLPLDLARRQMAAWKDRKGRHDGHSG